jgi:hypothetical protein
MNLWRISVFAKREPQGLLDHPITDRHSYDAPAPTAMARRMKIPFGDTDLEAPSRKKSIEVRHIVRNLESTWQLPGIPAQPLSLAPLPFE